MVATIMGFNGFMAKKEGFLVRSETKGWCWNGWKEGEKNKKKRKETKANIYS